MAKDGEIKVNYLTELVRLIGNQPLTGTSHALFYEAVWAQRYLEKLSNVQDINTRSKLAGYKKVINDFVKNVNIEKINKNCDNEVYLLSLKYNDARFCRAEEDNEEDTGFKNTLAMLRVLFCISTSFLVIILFVCGGKVSEFPGLVRVTFNIMCVVEVVLIFILGLDILMHRAPRIRNVMPRGVSTLHDNLGGEIYDREKRNIEWLDRILKDKSCSGTAYSTFYYLHHSTGIDYYKHLVEIEFLYMKSFGID